MDSRGPHLDVHVVPRDQTHSPWPWCWCDPIRDYTDAATGRSVWLHRRANDGLYRDPLRN